MSLAVLTDSTTATASPALTLRPTAGTSTNTTSVSSCCAWSVIPTVATSPATRTHSWELAYLRSEGTFELIVIRVFERLVSALQRPETVCRGLQLQTNCPGPQSWEAHTPCRFQLP